MNKIATHNSGTGEPCANFLSKLLIPFARCQSKSILEQLRSSCTYFDLRVDDKMRLSHGPWHSKTTLEEALQTINNHAYVQCYAQITYEYSLDDAVEEKIFVQKILGIMEKYKNIHLCCINVKKPVWKTLFVNEGAVFTVQGFKNLDGSSWHTYLPIPWLWDKIYGNHQFNDQYYIMVDFL